MQRQGRRRVHPPGTPARQPWRTEPRECKAEHNDQDYFFTTCGHKLCKRIACCDCQGTGACKWFVYTYSPSGLASTLALAGPDALLDDLNAEFLDVYHGYQQASYLNPLMVPDEQMVWFSEPLERIRTLLYRSMIFFRSLTARLPETLKLLHECHDPAQYKRNFDTEDETVAHTLAIAAVENAFEEMGGYCYSLIESLSSQFRIMWNPREVLGISTMFSDLTVPQTAEPFEIDFTEEIPRPFAAGEETEARSSSVRQTRRAPEMQERASRRRRRH